MATTTAHGLPIPESTDTADVPAVFDDGAGGGFANEVDTRLLNLGSMTTTNRDLVTAPKLRAGAFIWNTTTQQYEQNATGTAGSSYWAAMKGYVPPSDPSAATPGLRTLGTSSGQAAPGDSTVNLTGAQTVAGVKTFSSAPVVPDASFKAPALDIHGSTDIGAALADGDEMNVYDTSASANKKFALSRLWTKIQAWISGADLSLGGFRITSLAAPTSGTDAAQANTAIGAVVALGNQTGTVDLSSYTGANQLVTLTATGNLTFNATGKMPSVISGTAAQIVVKVTQDGTGSRTLTLTGIKAAGGSAPVLSTAASSVDYLVFWYDGTQWSCGLLGKAFA